MVFDDFKLCDAVRRGVEATGFNKPTPVQDQVIPAALEGNDLLVFAETGTGKTAAYGLPILEHLSRALGVTKPVTKGKAEAKDAEEPKKSAPGAAASMFALILGPTREVVTRAEGSLRSFGHFLPVRIRAIFGGVPAAPQRDALKRGLHVVAATPGRLAEILRHQEFGLDKVQVLVLDELDHLVQMNLMKEVNAIVERLPKERQTFVFANKRTPEVETLAGEFTRDPEIIEIARLEAPLESIRQVLYPVESTQKSDLLLEILRKQEPKKAVVFFRTRRSVDRLQPMIEKLGRTVAALHADRTPAQRQQAVEAFSSCEANTLVATEMAVRSLEVENITHLVNFDLPQFPDDYVNRIARCSQAEPVQEVISLVSVEDRDSLRRLEKHLGRAIERAKLTGFHYEEKGRRSVDRILAPAGSLVEAAGARADESAPGGRRPRRPSRPAPPVGKRVSAPAPEAAATEPKASAPSRQEEPAEKPEATAPPRQKVHPVERLSGRLTREAERMEAKAEAPAIREGGFGTPDHGRSAKGAEAQAAQSPTAPSPTAPSARPRPHFSLADEKRSPHPRRERERPSPPAARESRETKPPKRETPPPVTAGPAVKPLDEEDAREGLAGIPTVSFTSAAPPEKPSPTFPLRHPGEPKEPDLEEEEELEEDFEDEEVDEEEEKEKTARDRTPESGRTSGPGSRSSWSGRGERGRRVDRRPRRVRSWDLHRGGLLDSPPLHSTPFDTFITEERTARKRDSYFQATTDEPQAGSLPSTEPSSFETYLTQWVPIDWDHPSTRFGRPSRFIRNWQERVSRIEESQAEGGTTPSRPGAPQQPARGRSRLSRDSQPHEKRDRVSAQPPPLPAWPLAVDSDTSAATAPGVWWGPTGSDDPQASREKDSSTHAKASPKPAPNSRPTGKSRGRRGRPGATEKAQAKPTESAVAESKPAKRSARARRSGTETQPASTPSTGQARPTGRTSKTRKSKAGEAAQRKTSTTETSAARPGPRKTTTEQTKTTTRGRKKKTETTIPAAGLEAAETGKSTGAKSRTTQKRSSAPKETAPEEPITSAKTSAQSRSGKSAASKSKQTGPKAKRTRKSSQGHS